MSRDVSLIEVVLEAKRALPENLNNSEFWTGIGEGMVPYIYAGTQRKWVWMDRVSTNERIPFVHRTCGITLDLVVRGIKVFWRIPKTPE